jgi:hypothetical protein
MEKVPGASVSLFNNAISFLNVIVHYLSHNRSGIIYRDMILTRYILWSCLVSSYEYLLDSCQVVSWERIGKNDEANRYIFGSFNCEGPIDSFIKQSWKVLSSLVKVVFILHTSIVAKLSWCLS